MKTTLVNDGRLEVIPIGVGSMLSNTHFNTNYLIVKGDTHILVDCGRTAPEALRTLGISLTDIVNILPTHAHDDHIGGIGSVAAANRYIGQTRLGKPKLTMIAASHFAHSLWHESLKGNLAHNEQVGADHHDLEFHDWFNLVTPEVMSYEYRETSRIKFGGIEIRLFRTKHFPDSVETWRESHWSIGMLIDEKVFISGDTRFDPELISLYAPKASIIFHDCAFWNDPVHTPISDLRTLAPDIKRKMHLIHYGDNFAEQDISGFAGLAEQGKQYVIE